MDGRFYGHGWMDDACISVETVSTWHTTRWHLCANVWTPGSQLAVFGPGWDVSCHHEAVTLSSIQLGNNGFTGVRDVVSLLEPLEHLVSTYQPCPWRNQQVNTNKHGKTLEVFQMTTIPSIHPFS